MTGSGREPRGISLFDLMIAIAGVAVGFAVQPIQAETTRVVQCCDFYWNVFTYVSVYWTVARFALPAALALALVVLSRRWRYGGLPGPAEWLVMAAFFLLLDPAIAGQEHVNGPIVTRELTYRYVGGVRVPDRHVRSAVLVGRDDLRSIRQVLTTTIGLSLLVVGIGHVLVRRRLSTWVTTLALAALWWLWLRVTVRLNPVEVVRFRYAWLTITPLLPPYGWSWPWFDGYLEARLALGRWFLALPVAIAAAWAIRDLQRRGPAAWRWTEWAGAALATGLGLCWTWDELALRPDPGPVVRITVFVTWLATLALPAFWIAKRLEKAIQPGPPSEIV